MSERTELAESLRRQFPWLSKRAAFDIAGRELAYRAAKLPAAGEVNHAN